MAQLEKAVFVNLDTDEEIEVMYNPEKLQVDKKAKWEPEKRPGKDQPVQAFTGGDSRTMSVSLVMDTSGMEGETPEAEDVRQFTQPLALLAHVSTANEKAWPPRVLFMWGMGMVFECRVTGVSVAYTRFNPDGVPIRAEVKVDLVEDGEPVFDFTSAATKQAIREIRQVQEGQTLAQASGDSSQQQQEWRSNAQGDENPRRPATGPRPVS
jgi:hypothetical protein